MTGRWSMPGEPAWVRVLVALAFLASLVSVGMLALRAVPDRPGWTEPHGSRLKAK